MIRIARAAQRLRYLVTENRRVGDSTEARSAERRRHCELAQPALHSAPATTSSHHHVIGSARQVRLFEG